MDHTIFPLLLLSLKIISLARYAPWHVAANAAPDAWWGLAGDDEGDDARARGRPIRYGGDAAYVYIALFPALYIPIDIGSYFQV